MAADKGSGAGGSASAEIEKYLDILARDPNSRVFAPLAEAYRKAGLLDDAIETALEGLKVHPNYLGGRVALGRALFEKRQYAEAADELRKVVRAAPDNIIAHKVLGQIALAQGNLPDAEKAFKMVTLLDPHDQEAKRVVADIGSSAAAASPVPVAPQPVSPTEPPAGELSWQEMPLDMPIEAPLPLEGPTSHETPVEESLPSAPALPELLPMEEIAVAASDLEEPDEPQPLPVSETFVSEPEKEPALPVLEEMADGETFTMAEIESAEGPPVAPAAAAPEPLPEIEFFRREPAIPAAAKPEKEESPFTIFSKENYSRPAPPAREEREAYAEIEFEPTALAPAEAESTQEAEAGQRPEPVSDPDEEAVFEIFTRQPRGWDTGEPREGHGEGSAFRELEIEPTARLPQDELLPPIDQEPGPVEESQLPEEPVATVGEIGWEDELWTAAPPQEEEAAVPVMAPEEAATEELSWEEPEPSLSPVPENIDFEERIFGAEPFADASAAPEVPVESLAELPVETSPAEAPAVEPAAVPAEASAGEAPQAPPQAGRGVFDTETLATIYINQGFYGRAAAIYERLVAGSPEDEGLRRRLGEVRALERAHEGRTEGDGEPAAAAPTGRAGRAETIRRLEALLEAFRGARPR